MSVKYLVCFIRPRARLHEPFLLRYFIELNTSIAPEKCKKECGMLEIILVQGFCPLKIKITQFPDVFYLNFFFRVLHVSLKCERT